jgi:hypothetical protein
MGCKMLLYSASTGLEVVYLSPDMNLRSRDMYITRIHIYSTATNLQCGSLPVYLRSSIQHIYDGRLRAHSSPQSHVVIPAPHEVDEIHLIKGVFARATTQARIIAGGDV